MRPFVWLLVAGCGRIGFDAGSRADGATAQDAPPDGVSCAMVGNDDDGDGLVDACDPCPYLVDDGGDVDGDGVGDACDPSAGADRFVIFDPFTGTAFGPRWTSNGTVSIGGSVATIDGRGGAPFLGYSTVPATTEVAMRGTIDDIDTGIHMLSVQFGETSNPDAEYCEVYGAPGLALKITRAVGASFTSIAQVPMPALAPGAFVMRFRHSSAGFSCELTVGGQTYVANGPGDYFEPRSFTYLQFSGMLVRVDSFAEVQPAP